MEIDGDGLRSSRFLTRLMTWVSSLYVLPFFSLNLFRSVTNLILQVAKENPDYRVVAYDELCLRWRLEVYHIQLLWGSGQSSQCRGGSPEGS